MNAPLYNQHQSPVAKPEQAHAGLWFERFFNGYQSDWTLSPEAKQQWIKTVSGVTGQQAQLEDFVKRQMALCQQLKGSSQLYITDWHFITGMGNSHPVENGFAWHPTLAVPYLAGSAVKGLVRAWVELNDDGLSESEQKARLKSWFGSEQKGDVAEQAGHFIFFDAIPDQRPSLICDIMTPHMGQWYAEGDKGNPNNSQALPADWHEPIPVSFLAVKHAQFLFSIAPRRAEQVNELDAVFSALTQALDWLGAGAKTAAGYGYMSWDEKFSEELAEVAQQQALKRAEQERKANLSPVEKELDAFLTNIQPQEHAIRLLKELESSSPRWQGENAKVVAQKIQTLMEQEGKWIPEFPGTNAKKLELKARCQKVQSYLQG